MAPTISFPLMTSSSFQDAVAQPRQLALEAFIERFIGESWPFDNLVESISTIPLHLAAVNTIFISKGRQSTKIIAVLDISADPDRELLLGPHGTGLVLTVQRKLQEDSSPRGGRWEYLSELNRTSNKLSINEGTKIIRADFLNLRLFHLLDLFRIVQAVFNSAPSLETLHDGLNARDFVLATAYVLHNISNKWIRYLGLNSTELSPHNAAVLNELMPAIGADFFRRWSKEGFETVSDLTDFENWGSGPGTPICSRPSDGGPRFCFLIPVESIIRALKPNITTKTFSLAEFCVHALSASPPPESYATIRELKHYKEKHRNKHQFVTLRAKLDMRGFTPFEFWMRLDRAADLGTRRTTLDWLSNASSSTFPPDDKVRVALREESLIYPENPNRRIDVEVVFATEYKETAAGPCATVYQLAEVLEIFRKESTKYVLLTENCWYLSSLVREMLPIITQTPESSGSRTWVKIVPTSTFKKILDQYAAMQKGKDTPCDEETTVLALDVEDENRLDSHAITRTNSVASSRRYRLNSLSSATIGSNRSSVLQTISKFASRFRSRNTSIIIGSPVLPDDETGIGRVVQTDEPGSIFSDESASNTHATPLTDGPRRKSMMVPALSDLVRRFTPIRKSTVTTEGRDGT